ncbi:hypothetical protein [Croceiramulus getboli]|nr:hypothetical protein P8624_07575 [Flavobacteriaceae bacterium YJPT1-3]
MKSQNFLQLLAVLTPMLIWAQTPQAPQTPTFQNGASTVPVTLNESGQLLGQEIADIAYNAQSWNNFATFVLDDEDLDKVRGRYHALEDWNNKGVLAVRDGGKYIINSVNLNLRKDLFESRITEDSLFVFNRDNVEFLVINGRKFEYINSGIHGGTKPFEVLYEGDAIKLLMTYDLEVKQPESNDPLMIKSDKPEFDIDNTYYLKEGNSLRAFNVRKRDILDYFGAQKDKIKDFVKAENLSYRDARDFAKMLAYQKRVL